MANTFGSFLRRMDRFEQRLPLDELVERMAELDLTVDDVRPYVRFSADQYQRNLMHTGPAYEALILCWRPGQRSPIHDHPGSSCGMRILKGVATETTYERGDDGMLFETGSREMAAGFVCGSQDDDIHEIANLQPAGDDLITLHIYSPPLVTVNTYTLESPEIHVIPGRAAGARQGAEV